MKFQDVSITIDNKELLKNFNKTILPGETVVGSSSSTVYAVQSYNKDDIYDEYASNDEIEAEADLILDFTQSNPFGSY